MQSLSKIKPTDFLISRRALPNGEWRVIERAYRNKRIRDKAILMMQKNHRAGLYEYRAVEPGDK